MRAFIAGATGYTGRHVVARLAAAGHETIAHIRPASRSLASWQPRFATMGATVDTTAWEAEAMAATLQRLQPTHVFALLGTTARRQKTHEPDATYERVDRDLTLLLLAAAGTVSPPPVFVYLSSLGADTPRKNRYLQARHDVEQALAAGPVPWISARPSFITGTDRDEDRPAERVGAVVGDAALSLLGRLGASTLRDRYSSLTGDQLAAGLIGAADDPQVRNQVIQTEGLRPYVNRSAP